MTGRRAEVGEERRDGEREKSERKVKGGGVVSTRKRWERENVEKAMENKCGERGWGGGV